MNKRIFRTYFTLFLLLIMVWLLLNKYRADQYMKNEIENIITVGRMSDAYTSEIVLRNIQDIGGDLKVIGETYEMKHYLENRGTAEFSNLETLFLSIMKNKEYLSRMTFMGADGMERIRAERGKMPGLVPSRLLVDRSEDHFFKEASGIKEGQFYIESASGSPGQKKDGLMRFAAPVFDSQGALAGVLSISCSTSYFMQLMRADRVYNGMQNEIFYVVNETGKFLLYPTEILDHKSRNTPVSEVPVPAKGIFERLAGHSFYYEKSGSLLYLYYDVLSEVKASVPGFQNQYWVAVHRIDLSKIYTFPVIAREIKLVQSAGIYAVLVVLLSCLTVLHDKIRKKDHQLNMTMQIAKSSSDAVMVTDKDKRIIYVNTAYEKMSGYSSEEILGNRPGNYKSGRQKMVFYDRMWKSIHSSGGWKGLLWNRKKNGLLYPIILNIIAVKDVRTGETQNYIGLFSNLLAKGEDREISRPSEAGNGNQLMQTAEALIGLMEDSMKCEESNYLIMNIVIENYNQILAQIRMPELDISSIFFSMFRSGIKDQDIAVQIGRNHFLVVLAVKAKDADMEQIAERFLRQITKNVHYENTDFYFKVRIGCTEWLDGQKDLQQSYLNSMIALEWAQKNGLEGVLFYRESFTREMMQEAEIENLLKNAVKNQELYLVYQPQIDARTEQIVGAEALIRWENPVLGEIPPSLFIPIAEKSRMIIEIGAWVLEQVCRDLINTWKTGFMAEEEFHCAVNVSAIQLEESQFFEQFLSILEEHGISCQRIEIEVTESAFIANLDDRWNLLKDLQQRGISIAIDDFGTGYSSLSYLNHLPIDVIKIDRSFIKNYPDQDEGKLMEILVDMAKRLGKTVLAEGVETKQQLEYLNTLECDQIQGFIYSRPLGIRDFYDLYIQNRVRQKQGKHSEPDSG